MCFTFVFARYYIPVRSIVHFSIRSLLPLTGKANHKKRPKRLPSTNSGRSKNRTGACIPWLLKPGDHAVRAPTTTTIIEKRDSAKKRSIEFVHHCRETCLLI